MPYKDPEKAKEYNRKKKLEYYHKDPAKFNALRDKYKKTRATKEKQREYSDRYYRKKKTQRILSMELKEFHCHGDKCSIKWKALPNSKQLFCSNCAPNEKRWVKHDRELAAKKPEAQRK